MLEYCPAMSSSVSKENMRRCRVHRFFLRSAAAAAATDCGFSFVKLSWLEAILLFRLRMQTSRNATIARATTTIGTAIAACCPEDSPPLAFD